ncbi:hypothetical protein NLJ89_g3137 [Agrocybe chaxingu]|uniref:Anaphase-promoting complex subunit 10 n=1 Tax=Agrocybe chaxingu TaxID=84603 RepID=A0A9W8K5V6_9AGAR|nr:hypothetical protein NLJ89_g3137 [Agrocybe chaxingu]
MATGSQARHEPVTKRKTDKPIDPLDISHRAKWSVSSFKFGFGAECLLDDDPDTFWHVLLNYPLDDSYTPSALAIRAGTGPSDLQDIRMVTLDKPHGWVTFDVSSEPNEDGDGLNPVYAYQLQIIIAQNHMSGKDTHVRGLKVLGAIQEFVADDAFAFKSPNYRMYETLR